MFKIDRRMIIHFDFLLIILIVPIMFMSYFLISEVSQMLANKVLVYIGVGWFAFFVFFLIPIRRLGLLIPIVYWINIGLLIAVEFIGISRLGAKRWLELPFVHFTIQPAEPMKPALILMLAYIIKQNPPPKDGYNLKDFIKISIFILMPFILILKEPDLGTALILLIVGYGVLFIIGVNWKIWSTLLIGLIALAPFLYGNLHDYQKKRIKDFVGEKPSYHVEQSIIAIGSGGLHGKDKEEATQAQLKFLPIATSDFIFAYFVERFGFWGAFSLILIYAFLILHILSLAFVLKNDYFAKSIIVAISLLIFVYMGVNISMTIGLAPVVGVPLPLFSYGGSSFINFMILFGILENLLAFRFNFMYNSPLYIKGMGS